MRRTGWLVASLALLAILGPDGARAGIGVGRGTAKMFVLAVGVDTGPIASRFAAKDAAAFAAAFRDAPDLGATSSLFDSVSSEVLVEPKRQAILDALRNVVTQSSSDDHFVFFFAGCGAWLEGAGEETPGYHLGLAGGPPRELKDLVDDQRTVSAVFEQDLRRFGIPLGSIFAILRQVPCRRKLIILDCGMESGRAIDELVSFERTIRGGARPPAGESVAVLGLVGDSTEIRELEHGWLTYVLLEGLRGAADDALGPRRRDSIITARELEAFCYARLPTGTDKDVAPRGAHPRSYFRGDDFALLRPKDAGKERPEEPPRRGEAAPDREGPRIELVSPVPVRGLDLPAAGKALRLSIKVTDPGGVHDVWAGIRKDEQVVRKFDATQDEQGFWQAEVPVAVGENALVVAAADLSLNWSEATFKVVRSGGGPALERTGRSGKDYALLVAIDDYDHWTPLKSPIRDVNALGAVLRETYGFEVELLLNPTKRELLTRMREYVKRDFGEEDQFLVFFAGHGQLDELTDIGYLVTKDSRRGDVLGESYVSHMEFVRITDRIRCRHTLVMLDSCFGGAAFADGIRKERGDDFRADVPDAELIARKIALRSRKLVTAGGKEYVFDGGSQGHTPFTTRLLEALRSRDTRKSVLTLTEAVTFVERANPPPVWGGLSGDEPGSDFLFIPK